MSYYTNGSPHRLWEERLNLQYVHTWKQTQAGLFLAGLRFLGKRLWHLSNLQRCLHSSTHGSAETLTGNQPSALMHSLKVVLLQREPAPKRPMCLAWDKSDVRVQSHYKSVQHPPSFSLCFLISTALPLGAHRHSPQLNTEHTKQSGNTAAGRKRAVWRGKSKRARISVKSSKMCLLLWGN